VGPALDRGARAAFDQDPFLLFELRGRGKEQVLGGLRKLRAGRVGTEAAGKGRAEEPIPAVSLAGVKEPADFERLAGPIDTLRFRIEPPAAPAALLRQLGAPPSWCLEETPAEILGPVCAAAGDLARELALRGAGEVAVPLVLPPHRRGGARKRFGSPSRA
jgi:uncharacterized Zn finger protein